MKMFPSSARQDYRVKGRDFELSVVCLKLERKISVE